MGMKKRIIEYKGCQIRLKPRKLIPIFFHGDEATFDFIIESDTKQTDLAIPIQVRSQGERGDVNFRIEVAELLPNKALVESRSFPLNCIGAYQLEIPEEEEPVQVVGGIDYAKLKMLAVGGRVLSLHSFVVHSRGTLFLTAISAFLGALIAGIIINLLLN